MLILKIIINNFKVKHSMKHLNESTKKYPNLKPWIILYKNGTIAYAHCTCMAGLGEVCSHAAAIAFALYSINCDELSCTDKLCTWNVPKKLAQPKKMKDIDLGKRLKSFPSKYVYSNSLLVLLCM